MESLPTSDARDLEAALGEALSLHGVAGRVVLQGTHLELHRAGDSPVSIDVEHLAKQWPLLPADMRQRKVTELARRLAAAVRSGVVADEPLPAPRRRDPARTRVVPVGGVVVVAVIAALLWLGFRDQAGSRTSSRAPASASVTAPETPEQAVARRARVCDAARSRVYAGASLGPFETDGWVAELWLAKHKVEDLAHSIPIAELAPSGKLTASADEALAALPDGVLEVTSGIAGEGASAPGWSGVTLRFSGRYAGAFLDPSLRPRFLALSERLASSLSADVAALYGRCAHLRYHDLGAWFRGADASGAATALLYGIGAFAEVPAIDRGALAKLGAPSDLDAVRAASRKLDATAIASFVGAQGGGLTTSSPGAAVTITFPVLGGTRAITASRALARKLGIGVGVD